MANQVTRRDMLTALGTCAVLSHAGCVSAPGADGRADSTGRTTDSWPMPGYDPENTSRNDDVDLGAVSGQWAFEPERGRVGSAHPVVNARGVYLPATVSVQDGTDVGDLVAVGCDGSVRWSDRSSPPPGPPVLYGDQILVLRGERIQSFTAETGRPNWSVAVEVTGFLAAVPDRSVVLAPVSGGVRAIRPESEAVGRRYDPSVDAVRFGQPATDGKRIVTASTDVKGPCHVVAFEWSGSQLWAVQRGSTNAATVTLLDDRVLLVESSASGTTLRSFALADGSEQWSTVFEEFPGYSYGHGRPGVLSGTVAIPVVDLSQSPAHGTVVGLDVETGQRRWALDAVEGGYTGVTADARQFFATRGCSIVAIAPDGTVAWEEPLPSSESLGLPVPAQSHLVVPGRDRLYAFA